MRAVGVAGTLGDGLRMGGGGGRHMSGTFVDLFVYI